MSDVLQSLLYGVNVLGKKMPHRGNGANGKYMKKSCCFESVNTIHRFSGIECFKMFHEVFQYFDPVDGYSKPLHVNQLDCIIAGNNL